MRRLWPLALLALPALAMLGHLDRSPALPRKILRPAETPVETAELEIAAAPLPPEPAAASGSTPGAAPPEVSEESVPEPNAWRKSPILSSLVWMTRHQNQDGSWGDVPVTMEGHTIGKAGVSALALLANIGAGYSHYSKEEYDDQHLGKAVRRSFEWFLKDQRQDGTFGSVCDGGFDQALAAYALNEAYGMTAAQMLKEPSQKALDALVRMQGPDGSWSAPAPTAWAMQALLSADLNEQPYPIDVKERVLQYAGTASHLGMLATRMIFNRRKTEADADRVSALQPPDSGDLAGWLQASLAVYQVDAPAGPQWTRWKQSMKEAMLGTQDRDGSWTGGTLSNTVVRSSLALQTLEILYFRYHPVFESAK
jgi:hypothetical protein